VAGPRPAALPRVPHRSSRVATTRTRGSGLPHSGSGS
jgi:hypothetical protein